MSASFVIGSHLCLCYDTKRTRHHSTLLQASHLAGAMHRMKHEVIAHNNQYHNGDQRYHDDWRSRFLGMSFDYEPHIVHVHSDGSHHRHKIDTVRRVHE